MSSISRFTPAAVNNTVEVAPALANLNFDFSLWKIDAPKEFDGVGAALSKIRREEAENGMPHITARKLGALFESILPSTPNVYRAYGQRASEISQASSVNPQIRSKYGVFSSRVGSDATSIWAAATSGPPAIAIHLLACMLARIWDGPEATSIWAEIVQRRKELIFAEMDCKNIIEMTTLGAARQDITRAQIAGWDASARSWLRTADAVKTRQQKQLMLILDNVKGSVNKRSDTYESVITAWKDSLTQMEGLIQGISQQAMNGGILLALSAWHLYPDMLVVVPCKTQVCQHDEIFKSGVVLTIGLEKPDLEQSGICWSLPLASLRHYGAPVVSSCSINSNERSRLSLTEFTQAFLGAFLQGWGDSGSDTQRAVSWLARISGILNDAASAGSLEAKAMISAETEVSWLRLILSAANYYLDCAGNEKLIAKKLIHLGRRYGKAFLGLPKAPMFNLLELGSFASLIETDDDRIDFLRKVAEDIRREMRLESHQIFIRYKHTCMGSNKTVHEYATAVPLIRHSVKRKLDNSEHEIWRHCRWLYAGTKDLRDIRSSNYDYGKRLDRVFNEDSNGFTHRNRWTSVPDDFSVWHASHGRTALNGRYWSDREVFDAAGLHLIQQDFERRTETCSSRGEYIVKRESEQIEDFAADRMGIFWEPTGKSFMSSSQKNWYSFLYGDIDTAAIFAVESERNLIKLIRTDRQESQELYSLFESDTILMNPTAVVGRLAFHFQTANVEADPYMQSAKAVSTAAMLYRDLADATIDIRVLQCRLWNAQWVRAAASRYGQSGVSMTSSRSTPPSLEPYYLDRACAFACVTMFESGHYNASPSELEDVMAMSSGDSLYVGAALLCGPSPQSYSGAIKRVAGNIGRPGIAFLVPPITPLMKEVSINEWPQTGRFEFDGIVKDCFKNTSLHLSFTGANTPVNLGFSGAQDADVYMLETLISVHDSGKWIADLNILNTFRSAQLKMMGRCGYEHHNAEGSRPSCQVTSIDNWLQLVDQPEEPICLVQTHGNWEARLAAGSISIAKSYLTIIAPENICWFCVADNIFGHTGGPTPIIVIS